MKPSRNQLRVANLVKRQAQIWLITNDIHSPTHYSEIEQEIDSYLDHPEITDEQRSALELKLKDLYQFIKTIEG